jgi:hypothetical protein
MYDSYHISERITEQRADLVVEPGVGESATEALLRGIAAVKGVDESDLDPIYERVDPVALENIVDHADGRDEPVGVRFAVAGCTVSVREDRSVRIVERA